MEFTSVLKFLENRTILVTGATGFLAKIFVEKILRVQPNVKKLYLLLRAADDKSAMQRFNTEIVGKELFKVLREKCGPNFTTFVSQRTRIVAGDITCENLGVKDTDLLEEMWKEVDIVVNLAATTNFDERARKYGWPNTYVFTKAMGEMLLGKLKEEVALVINRPTIITSTFKEPFPGWVEGIRTIDSLAVGYGKGRITCFPGNPKTILDVIPADMVVNSMIVAMMAHANQRGSESIYQIGSSVSNPLDIINLRDYGFNYFTKHPWINKVDGKPIIVGKVNVLSSMDSFQRYMALHYLLPLKGLEIVNAAFCQYFQAKYLELYKKIKFVMRLIDLYGPYLFFKAVFDDINTEKLRRAAKESGIETQVFYFDPKMINWEDYFLKIHFPGVVRYVFK
ncbi:unnamed protein product [Withania somnifera]